MSVSFVVMAFFGGGKILKTVSGFEQAIKFRWHGGGHDDGVGPAADGVGQVGWQSRAAITI
jgi:hypothetical protein